MAAERMRARLMQNSDFYPALESERDPRFGPIPGIPVGTTFMKREECSRVGLHSRQFAGISGTIALGAFSVVLSGGYEDDKDEGDFFTYTGTGGQDDPFKGTGPQISDQSFDHSDNQALMKSVETQRPVRVIRGPNVHSQYAPTEGYRYDGLYLVKRAYMAKGKSGYQVCKYDLQRLPGQTPLPPK